jgi:hypothetical protein
MIALVLAYPVAAVSPPDVSGRVLLDLSGGARPLVDGMVELRGDDSRMLQSYTDRNGYFAFYDVPKGRYQLIIRIGGRALAQVGEGRRNTHRRIDLMRDPIQLPDLLVAPH